MTAFVAALVPKAAVPVSTVYVIIAGVLVFFTPYIWPRLWFRRKGISWTIRLSPRYLWFWWRRITGLGVVLSVGYPIVLRVLVPKMTLGDLGLFGGWFPVFVISFINMAFQSHYINLLVNGVRGPVETAKLVRQLARRALLGGLGVAACSDIILGVVARLTGW